MKRVELTKAPKGVISVVFPMNKVHYYNEYQFIDYKGDSYLVAHREDAYFDLFRVAPFKEKAFGDYIERGCIKLADSNGFTRLFGWDKSMKMHFEVFQGYDFSPFENAVICNIGFSARRNSRLVIFDEAKILVDRTGVLVSNGESGVVLANQVSAPRKYFCWKTKSKDPLRLSPCEIGYNKFLRSKKKGFFRQLWELFCR